MHLLAGTAAVIALVCCLEVLAVALIYTRAPEGDA